MQKISSRTELKNAILKLEIEQAVYKQQIKEEIQTTYKKIRNVSIVAGTIKSIISATGNNVLTHTTGVAAGYLIKKIVVGKSENKFRKILGSVLQFGATSFLTQNPKIIEKAGQFILKFMPHKGGGNTSDNDK